MVRRIEIAILLLTLLACCWWARVHLTPAAPPGPLPGPQTRLSCRGVTLGMDVEEVRSKLGGFQGNPSVRNGWLYYLDLPGIEKLEFQPQEGEQDDYRLVGMVASKFEIDGHDFVSVGMPAEEASARVGRQLGNGNLTLQVKDGEFYLELRHEKVSRLWLGRSKR